MVKNLKKVNCYAIAACSSKNSLVRWYFKWRYHRVANKYAAANDKARSYRRGNRKVNTYPWPYSDPEFATWIEDGAKTTMDPSNCVIRSDVSYCAYKIYEATGKWLKPLRKGQVTSARDWPEILTANGYTEVANEQQIIIANRGYYVGISKAEGGNIRCCWYEHYTGSQYGLVEVSTYANGSFKHDLVMLRNYTWIRIQ